MVLLKSAATHPWGLPPSGHNAWGKACSVLFGWDTQFCKKLKKKKRVWRLPCACAFLEGLAQGLQVPSLPFSWPSLGPGPAQGDSNQTVLGAVTTASWYYPSTVP